MVVSPDPNLAPEPTPDPRFHRLPLISALLASVFPAFFIGQFFASGLVLLGPFVELLSLLSVLTIPATLVTGHLALIHAKRDPTAQADRGLAIPALVLGYFSLAVVVGEVVLILSRGGFGD